MLPPKGEGVVMPVSKRSAFPQAVGEPCPLHRWLAPLTQANVVRLTGSFNKTSRTWQLRPSAIEQLKSADSGVLLDAEGRRQIVQRPCTLGGTLRHCFEDGWIEHETLTQDAVDPINAVNVDAHGSSIASEVNLEAKAVRPLRDYPRGFPLEWETMKPLRESKRHQRLIVRQTVNADGRFRRHSPAARVSFRKK